MDFITFFVGLWLSIAVFLLLATHLDHAEYADVCEAPGDADASAPPYARDGVRADGAPDARPPAAARM